MKRKKLLILGSLLIVITFSVILLNYHKFIQQKRKFPEIEKIINESYSSISGLGINLELYFDNVRNIPMSYQDFINEIAIDNDVEKEEILGFYNFVFRDPWSLQDSGVFMLKPVYRKNKNTPIGNLVISCGVDGKMNFKDGTVLYEDELNDAEKFYNYRNFYIYNEDFPEIEKSEFTFLDYVFGNKDFIVMYIDYYKCKQILYNQEKIQSHNEYAMNNIYHFQKKQLKMNNSTSLYVTHYSNYLLEGYLYIDSTVSIKSSILSLPCEINISKGDLVELNAIFSHFDSISNTIYFEKGLVYPIELKD